MTTNEPDLSIEFAGDDCFVVFEGARIAKREDGKWISLVSGYAVTSMIPNRDELTPLPATAHERVRRAGFLDRRGEYAVDRHFSLRLANKQARG
jgi:hypothetical protein